MIETRSLLAFFTSEEMRIIGLHYSNVSFL